MVTSDFVMSAKFCLGIFSLKGITGPSIDPMSAKVMAEEQNSADLETEEGHASCSLETRPIKIRTLIGLDSRLHKLLPISSRCRTLLGVVSESEDEWGER